MRRILINALSATTGGALPVSRGLSNQLARDCPEWEFELICSDLRAAPSPSPINLRCRELPQVKSPLRRWIWEQLSAPTYIARRQHNALLALGGFVPFLTSCPKVAIWQNANIWTPPASDLPAHLHRYIAMQKMVMRYSVRLADFNVFLSQDSLLRCQEAFAVPEERAAVVPLGLDPALADRAETPDRADREDLLVMVGDLYAHKGYDLALRALALLEASQPTLRLAIAGSPFDPVYSAKLRQLTSELRIADRVSFLGTIEKPEVVRLYERGLLYVNASRLETFGLTPIEAMACGLPVVSSRRSASPEICGDAAIYFEPYTAERLAEAIADLINSPEDWRKRRVAGLERAKRFNWRAVSCEYRQILESLIGRSSDRGPANPGSKV